MVSGKEQADAQADSAAPGAAGVEPGKRRASRSAAKGKDGNVGSALRSVYQQTVNEDVPDEMMQLLGKLT